MSLKNDRDPPRSFHLQQVSPKLIWSFQVIFVDFGEVAVGVSPGTESGIGFSVGNPSWSVSLITGPNNFARFANIAHARSKGRRSHVARSLLAGATACDMKKSRQVKKD